MSPIKIFPVQTFDYDGLVKKMASAGLGKMAEVLNSGLQEIPKPGLVTERDYFWKALHNAAMGNTPVWVWFRVRFPDLSASSGYLLPEEIDPNGEKIDYEAEAKAEPKQYPSESTEENFKEQAEALKQYFKENAQPGDPCGNINQYVDTFRYSGTGKMSAQMQLKSLGFNALATQVGIKWLIEHFPPDKGSN